MKTKAVILNATMALQSKDGQCKKNFLIADYIKRLLFTIAMIVTTLIVNAQSIEEQAEKAGNEAFANAMIRNIMIIIGVVVIFALFKSGKSNKNSDNLK